MPFIKRVIPILSILSFCISLHAQSLKAVQQIEGIPPKVQYRAITHDGSGNLYVATSVDVFMIPSNSNQAQPMSVGDQIVDVDWSQDYGLIMLSKDGAIRFTATGKVITVDAGTGATCMDVTKTMVWVGTHNGVSTVSIPQEKVVNQYTTDNSDLESNEITFIQTDHSGVRWVGSRAGVVRIEGKKWKLYEEKQAVTGITTTSEGAWMAADSNMWLVDSYNRWYPIDAWRDLVQGPVKALSSDSKGIIYIASDMLVKYDPYEEKIVSMNEGGATDQMILLSQGPGKNVWMAGHNGLSRVIEDTTKVVMPEVRGDRLVAVVEVKSTPVCTGMNTGHLMVKAAGGVPPYSYIWSVAPNTGEEITGLPAGLYQVTVTDQMGKTMLASAIIPASPVMTLKPTINSKSSDILATDGKATAALTGGVEPYTYKWSNGETTPQALALPEGSHTITVMDANGCIATASVNMEGEKVLKTLDIATISVGQTIRVDKLYFEADSSTIKPESYAVLEEIYTFLHDNDKVKIEIGGHTNSLPEDAYCDKLSTARAKDIAEYLYDKGIPQSQISYKGYGKRQPVATNATVDGRRKNQRVEIKIVSL
jgi:outer membrane protein OmpA-like peptidoglycan-associated protein